MTTNHILAPWTKTQTERGSVIFANDGNPIYTPERTAEQREAMAQLIAAAPELLEALQAYQDANRIHHDGEALLYELAAAAIAKATGENVE